MTDRIPLDDMTSDQLDHLYTELDALRQVARGYCPACGRGDAAPTVTDWEQQKQRADQAEAALTRVRKTIDSVKAASYGGPQNTPYDRGTSSGVAWVTMRVLEAIDARLVNGGQTATEATEPDPAAAEEAVRQMDADPHGLQAGMIVKAYRDHGETKWVFRCWGTDTCDGALSLDHYSQQSAERARDRHVAEAHPAAPGPCPACRRADQAGLAPGELHDDCAKEQH